MGFRSDFYWNCWFNFCYSRAAVYALGYLSLVGVGMILVCICVRGCVILQADVICILLSHKPYTMLRYLHVDLISMDTEGKRAAWQQMSGKKFWQKQIESNPGQHSKQKTGKKSCFMFEICGFNTSSSF